MEVQLPVDAALMQRFPSIESLELDKFLESFSPEDFLQDPVSVLDFNAQITDNSGNSSEVEKLTSTSGNSDSNAASPQFQLASGSTFDTQHDQQTAGLLDHGHLGTRSGSQAQQPTGFAPVTLPTAAAVPGFPAANEAGVINGAQNVTARAVTSQQLPGAPAFDVLQQQGALPQLAFNSITLQQAHFAAAAGAAAQAKSKPKRFRERQKEEIASLEQEVQRKMQQLQMLEAENDQLKLRQRVLEALVQGRDEQLKVLQEHGPPSYNPQQHAGSKANGTSCADSSNTCSKREISEQADTGVLKPGCVEKIKMASHEMVGSLWKRFVSEVSAVLLDLQSKPQQSPEAHARLAELVKVNGFIARHISLLNPLTRQQLCSRNLESGTVQAADEAHWLQVLLQLELSAQQQKDIAGAHELYLSYISKVMAERTAITQEMDAMAPPPAALRQATTCDKPCLHAAKYDQALQRLASNLKREYAVNLMLSCFFFRCLSVQQFAKVAVHAYPWFPDPISCASLLAGVRLQPQATLQQ